MSNFETIDSALLVTATGGAQRPPRTWGQVGRDYVAACVSGAERSVTSGGTPRGLKDAGIKAATGCVIGVAQQGVNDLTNAVGGEGQ